MGEYELVRGDWSPAELVGACRLGSAAAWEELVSRYERLVFTIARREGLSVDDAADVTQITFEAMLAQVNRIRDDGQIAFWLMSVARRQAWLVRAKRARTESEIDVASLEETGSEDMARVENLMWLRDALARLDGPCRELITRLYFDPCRPSYEQLAVAMDRPVGSIGPIRARCLERLRNLLEGT